MAATGEMPEDPAVHDPARLSISLVGNRRDGWRRHSAHTGWEINGEV
jgi:hypothetical protein